MIPNKLSIVQYWEQGNPPLPLLSRCRDWQLMNPEWDYICFDLDSAARFIDDIYGHASADAFLDIRFPAMKADVFRVAYLLRCGGLWVDVATTCRVPLAEWLDLRDWLTLVRRPHMEPPLVCNGFIYARNGGNTFLADLWKHIETVILSKEGTGVWRLVGPGAYRDILLKSKYPGAIRILEEVEMSPYFTFGSTAAMLPPEEHWSARQRHESLYYSVPDACQKGRAVDGLST